VKSNRITATSSWVNVLEMREAATTSFPQVKQCANNATARGRPVGQSSRPAKDSPPVPVNVVF
jgi:hypothetical protein